MGHCVRQKSDRRSTEVHRQKGINGGGRGTPCSLMGVAVLAPFRAAEYPRARLGARGWARRKIEGLKELRKYPRCNERNSVSCTETEVAVLPLVHRRESSSFAAECPRIFRRPTGNGHCRRLGKFEGCRTSGRAEGVSVRNKDLPRVRLQKAVVGGQFSPRPKVRRSKLGNCYRSVDEGNRGASLSPSLRANRGKTVRKSGNENCLIYKQARGSWNRRRPSVAPFSRPVALKSAPKIPIRGYCRRKTERQRRLSRDLRRARVEKNFRPCQPRAFRAP